MKHLLNKLAISLLVTSVELPLVNADASLLEVPRVDSSNLNVSPESLNPNNGKTFHTLEEILKHLNDTEAQVAAELKDGNVQKERAKFKKIYNELVEKYRKLKIKFDALSESEKQLKIENAALKTEQEKHRAEKQSAWQRFKNWIFKLDVTKVTTTIITGLITVISTLLIILL